MANIIQINGKNVKDSTAARMASLAPVEASTTATAAHAVGEYFWLGGALYEATAAIAVGSTITVGTNCKVVDINNMVQPDWNQSTTTARDYIKNKPAIRQQANGGGILENGASSASGQNSHAEGGGTTASGAYSHAEGGGTTSSGQGSHAEGSGAEATGNYSHAEGGGTKAIGEYSHAEGAGAKTIGAGAHAEGSGTTASSSSSHAEGESTTASGGGAHSEGGGTTASGNASHAEGGSTTASGRSSHAEGGGTVASGDYSHAEGSNTTANHMAQHVFGMHNVPDSSAESSGAKGNYVEIVGNGLDVNRRSNARTLDWEGNEEVAGDIIAYGCGGANPISLADLKSEMGVATSGTSKLASFSGTNLIVNAATDQNASASVESSESSVDVWQYNDNMLPPINGFTLMGVQVTVEDDGTFVFNGTTTGNSTKQVLLDNVPIFNPNNLWTYFLHSESNKPAPNSEGYILIQVIDDQNRNFFSHTMKDTTPLIVDGRATYPNAAYLKAINIRFYNLPVGTVFTDWRLKLSVNMGVSAAPYAPPSLRHDTVAIIDGYADHTLQLNAGVNYVITNADSIAFSADAIIGADDYIGKRWACFGDSITQKNTDAYNAGAKRYYDLVSAQLGLSCIDYGRATTGYSASGNVSNGQYYIRMQDVNPDMFDFMTIMGSTNDVGGMARGTIQLGTYTDTGTETVCGCINTTLDYYYSIAPLKPIGMISMLPTYAYGPNLINTTVAENYVNAQKQICANRGIPFLDLYHGSGMRPWVESIKQALYSDGDGIHPNNEGIKWFAPKIREFVKTLM